MAVSNCWPRRFELGGSRLPLKPSPQGGLTDGWHIWDESPEVECHRCGQIGPGFVRRMDGEERCKPKEG